MSNKFLKLSKYIINIHNIQYIKIEPTKIEINIGLIYDGLFMVGSGGFSSEPNKFEIKNDSPDYNIVKDWIDRI